MYDIRLYDGGKFTRASVLCFLSKPTMITLVDDYE